MLGVPLPPRGRTCVLYTIADRMCLLSRPPPNKLAGVDFSFRPLFCCLSIPNIFNILACVLTEHSIVFATKVRAGQMLLKTAFISTRSAALSSQKHPLGFGYAMKRA